METTSMQSDTKKDLVGAMSDGIRVHAANRGEGVTLCGHPVRRVGAEKGATAVNCRLCLKIAGDSKIVLRPRAR